MKDRFIIDPTLPEEEIVEFIMSYLRERGAFEETPLNETRLLEHPGGPSHDQKSHGGKGAGTTGKVSDPDAAASYLVSGGSPNVTSADLDDVMRVLAVSAPSQINLMNLHVDGVRVTGDMGMPFPRREMPQFDGDNKTRFINDVEGTGVKITRESVDPSTLRPGQNEIDASKTGGMFNAIDQGKMTGQDPIIVSNDNRVIDGNHRYAAMSMARQDGHPNITIDVIRVDMPASTLLPLAKDWVAVNGIANRGLGS